MVALVPATGESALECEGFLDHEPTRGVARSDLDPLRGDEIPRTSSALREAEPLGFDVRGPSSSHETTTNRGEKGVFSWNSTDGSNLEAPSTPLSRWGVHSSHPLD